MDINDYEDSQSENDLNNKTNSETMFDADSADIPVDLPHDAASEDEKVLKPYALPKQRIVLKKGALSGTRDSFLPPTYKSLATLKVYFMS